MSRAAGYTLVFAVLGGFFVWVVLEMAVANGDVWRVVKLGGVTIVLLVGAALVYTLLWPLRRRRGGSAG